MANVYYEKDADRSLIADRKVAILGYGSQGHAHALNLKDSGVDVRVGLRDGLVVEGQGRGGRAAGGVARRGVGRGRRHHDPAARHRDADGVRRADIAPNLNDGDALFFAHGFNVRFGYVQAPGGRRRGHGRPQGPRPPRAPHLHRGRRRAVPHRRGARTPPARPTTLALAYADAIGGTRAGVLETTFEEETETDLFGEQVVLCGGLTALVQAGFETLVEAGYQPESAYFECLHELKLIVDLMYEQGIAGMRYSISDTAEYGDLTRGPRIITDETKAEMKKILGEIQDGAVRRGVDRRGRGRRRQLRRAARRPARTTRSSRSAPSCASMMPWISAGKTKVEDASGGD